MWVVTTVAGALLSIAVLTDAVTTTVNVTERSGKLTELVLAVSRQPLRAAWPKTRRPSAALSQVVLLILTWTVLLWLGWWLILLGEPMRFVHGADGRFADALDTLYVAGFGVFALGVGDIGPASRPAQLLLPLSAATGLILVTLEITYLLTLTGAAAHKRQVARMIHGLGDDADQIGRHCWTGTSFGPAREVFNALSTEMALLAEHQLAFPVLYEFGARRETLAVAPGLVKLLDALHLMHDRSAPEVRLPQLTSHQLVTSIEDVVSSSPVAHRAVALSPEPGTGTLETLGVPVAADPPPEVRRELRRRLHVLADEEGWPMASEDGR